MQYIRTFAIQIFSALAFLKEQHIIHSDIKPENILLKNRYNAGIKLIDFGTTQDYSYSWNTGNPNDTLANVTVSPTVETDYIITVNDLCGMTCSSFAG